MNRRQVLIAAAALPLVGCAAATTAVSDIETAASALDSILPDIQKIAGLPTATYTAISNDIAAVVAGAQQFTATATSTVGGQIASAFTAAETVLQGFTLPSWVSTVFQAASAALPFILQVAGVALAKAPGPAFTYPEAMRILHAAAGK
jgi:hypothetical protein